MKILPPASLAHLNQSKVFVFCFLFSACRTVTQVKSAHTGGAIRGGSRMNVAQAENKKVSKKKKSMLEGEESGKFFIPLL